jgi:hypothetical protein
VEAVVKAFQKRHLIAHKMGIVDDGYLTATGDTGAVSGRKMKIDNGEAQELNRFLMLMGALNKRSRSLGKPSLSIAGIGLRLPHERK